MRLGLVIFAQQTLLGDLTHLDGVGELGGEGDVAHGSGR